MKKFILEYRKHIGVDKNNNSHGPQFYDKSKLLMAGQFYNTVLHCIICFACLHG